MPSKPRLNGAAAILGAYLLALLASDHRLLASPRFWAEESTVYYLEAVERGWRILGFVTVGNYQLLTNVSVFLASLVPPIWAPTVTTYLALGADVVAVLGILTLYRAGRLDLRGAVLLAVFWVLAAVKYEETLTATNMMWTCAVGFVFFLAAPSEALHRRRWLLYPWTVACGLTGVATSLLFPAFLLRGVLDRQRVHLAVGVVLMATSIVHAAVILHGGLGGRGSVLDPYLMIAPVALQTVLTPLLGRDLVDAIGAILRNPGFQHTAGGVAPLILLAAACAGAGLLTWREGLKVTVLALICLWIGTGVVQASFGLGGPLGFLSGGTGARYFLTGVFCMALLLALGERSPDQTTSRVAVAFLVLLVALAAVQRFRTPNALLFFRGPDWRAQVAACPEHAPCVVQVWPESWTLTLPPEGRR